MGSIDWSDPILLVTAVPVTLGTLTSTYILLTGRWITWPVRPKRAPTTVRCRRTVAAGTLLLFLTLGLGDLFYVPGLRQIPSALRLFELPLSLISILLVAVGWKLPPAPEKHYKLEGWPPPKEPGRR